MIKRLFLYGVPGSGKTHVAKLLGARFNIKVLEGDIIRKKANKNKPLREFPFLHLGTCQAYKQFGDLTPENARKGLFAVRKALQFAVEREVKRRNGSFVLEAAFLDPKTLASLGKIILLTTMDEARHKRQFLHHREKLLDITDGEFRAARINQKYLVDEANKLGIPIIDNNENLERSLATQF